MRDSQGNADRYDYLFKEYNRFMGWREENFKIVPLERKINYYCREQAQYSKRIVVHRYGRGDALEEIQGAVRVHTNLLIQDQRFLQNLTENDKKPGYAVYGIWRDSTAFAFLALLIVESEEYPALIKKLIDPDIESRAYLTDILFKAFIPGFSMARKYKIDKYSAVWMDPIQRALAKPAEERADALALHMKSWCRIMRPWGWKPDLKPEQGGDNLFCDFAFEVAAAVCAYDIDDSTFNDHPYYPRDLVEHYRTKVRHTRDAWREHGVGAGVPVAAPPLPKKADLAKSKRKSIARWVELVCDGNIDVTEAVLETIGRPRKLDDIGELMAALGESNEAIHADIKDDETTLILAGRVAERRGLGEFDGPPGPPFGPARCRAGLLAFAQWLQPHGYRLVDLDNDDDAWHAVVVKADYHAELIELSNTLKIRTRTPEAVYND